MTSYAGMSNCPRLRAVCLFLEKQAQLEQRFELWLGSGDLADVCKCVES